MTKLQPDPKVVRDFTKFCADRLEVIFKDACEITLRGYKEFIAERDWSAIKKALYLDTIEKMLRDPSSVPYHEAKYEAILKDKEVSSMPDL